MRKIFLVCFCILTMVNIAWADPNKALVERTLQDYFIIYKFDKTDMQFKVKSLEIGTKLIGPVMMPDRSIVKTYYWPIRFVLDVKCSGKVTKSVLLNESFSMQKGIFAYDQFKKPFTTSFIMNFCEGFDERVLPDGEEINSIKVRQFLEEQEGKYPVDIIKQLKEKILTGGIEAGRQFLDNPGSIKKAEAEKAREAQDRIFEECIDSVVSRYKNKTKYVRSHAEKVCRERLK